MTRTERGKTDQSFWLELVFEVFAHFDDNVRFAIIHLFFDSVGVDTDGVDSCFIYENKLLYKILYVRV